MVLELLQAARDLHKLGPKYVLIKGGHLITPPPSNLTTPSPLPPGPHTSGPPPSDPTTPSPAALNPCTDAASSPSSSAPQTSLEAASSTQDPATQSSESLLASASDDISQPADVSMSDTHGQGGSAAINGHRDTDTDAHTGASEQTTRKSEGKQDKLVSLHRNTSCRMTKHQTSCALYNAVLQAHMKALLCWVQYSHERFPFGSRELEGGGGGERGGGQCLYVTPHGTKHIGCLHNFVCHVYDSRLFSRNHSPYWCILFSRQTGQYKVWAEPSCVGMHTGAGDHKAETEAASPGGDAAEKHESNAPATDVLFDGQEVHVLESKRVHTHNTHGTGKIGLLCF